MKSDFLAEIGLGAGLPIVRRIACPGLPGDHRRYLCVTRRLYDSVNALATGFPAVRRS